VKPQNFTWSGLTAALPAWGCRKQRWLDNQEASGQPEGACHPSALISWQRTIKQPTAKKNLQIRLISFEVMRLKVVFFRMLSNLIIFLKDEERMKRHDNILAIDFMLL
jgi:hypothetical protein